MRELTTDEQREVEQDAARLGLTPNSDGSWTWERYPLWRLEAMTWDTYEAVINSHGGNLRTTLWRTKILWLAELAEAVMPSEGLSYIKNLTGMTGVMMAGRPLGGEATYITTKEVTDLISAIEAEWDKQRAATAAAVWGAR